MRTLIAWNPGWKCPLNWFLYNILINANIQQKSNFQKTRDFNSDFDLKLMKSKERMVTGLIARLLVGICLLMFMFWIFPLLCFKIGFSNTCLWKQEGHWLSGIFFRYSVGPSTFKMTGSSSSVNRDDASLRSSPRPPHRGGPLRDSSRKKSKDKKDDSGSDNISRSGSFSSVDSADQTLDMRGRFDRVNCLLNPYTLRGMGEAVLPL